MPPPVIRASQARIPAVDRVLHFPAVFRLVEDYGRLLVTEAVRTVLADFRQALAAGRIPEWDERSIGELVHAYANAWSTPSLRRVFNLTGTVLHTNLGRSPLPPEAVAAVARAAGPANLEYDLDKGRRGDRDVHVEGLLTELTGAEAATVVNNNAAAVFLVLNTLALRKQVPVSRGELVEIGDAFRIPDIMARAGCRLQEVGTTNRTHLWDFEQSIGPRTGMLMKVHTSNYAIQGFTAAVPEEALAALAHGHGLPFVVDLGSGSLVDLRRYGLPYEPTPQDALGHGADLITFSGDKLLGGPQAGIIVGRADLVKRIKRNPIKRALRLGKMSLAALEAVLRLYRDPDRLAERLPALRLLTRPEEEIAAQGQRLRPVLEQALAGKVRIELLPCRSQIGSGALPVDALPSHCLRLVPHPGRGRAVEQLAAAFRALPIPVVGRVEGGALCLDLRCLDDEAAFLSQLAALNFRARP
ncbi:L-seryl-tRNA(Sec) selenium transferase [Acidithiobacillus sp.]